MTRSVTAYKTLVFDCDGVVLDSNHVKTEAFRQAAMPWGKEAAEALVAHHVSNGGISRYKKFDYFIDQILPQHAPNAVPGRDGPDLQALIEAYSVAVREGLLTCAVAEGLENLRMATQQSRWMIVSGGDQAELRDIFAQRELAGLFNGGIFGSPDSKHTILAREKAKGNLELPALFLGDSKFDHCAGTGADLDFVFISGWSEVEDWKKWSTQHRIANCRHVASLLEKMLDAGCPEAKCRKNH